MWQTKYASIVPINLDLIFGRAVKVISSPGIRSLRLKENFLNVMAVVYLFLGAFEKAFDDMK